MNKSLVYTLIAVVVIAVLGVALWPYAFTVVPIQEVEAAAASEVFDPVSYVDSIWASQLLPTVQEQAVDLPTILGALNPDENGTMPKDDLVKVAESYGSITVGEAHVYMVKGSGTVTKVDTSKSTGFIEITLDGYDGPVLVRLLIGPRIPSDETSVRDAVGFINFGDFKEQTEYGKVASEINKRVNLEVLSKLPKDQLEGKQLSFYGAFTIRTFNLINIDVKQVTVVPVSVEVK